MADDNIDPEEERRERARERTRRWRAKKASTEAGREELRAKKRAAYARNPEHYREKQAEQRAAQKQRLEAMPPTEREAAEEQNRAMDRKYANAYYARNRERILAEKARQRRENPERFHEMDRRTRENTAEQRRTKRAENRERDQERGRQWRRELRLEAVAAYGGECVCCGEDYEPYLEFDHINNDGKQERAQRTSTLELFLKRNDWPEGFQLLCANCHRAKTKGVPCKPGGSHQCVTGSNQSPPDSEATSLS